MPHSVRVTVTTTTRATVDDKSAAHRPQTEIGSGVTNPMAGIDRESHRLCVCHTCAVKHSSQVLAVVVFAVLACTALSARAAPIEIDVLERVDAFLSLYEVEIDHFELVVAKECTGHRSDSEIDSEIESMRGSRMALDPDLGELRERMRAQNGVPFVSRFFIAQDSRGRYRGESIAEGRINLSDLNADPLVFHDVVIQEERDHWQISNQSRRATLIHRRDLPGGDFSTVVPGEWGPFDVFLSSGGMPLLHITDMRGVGDVRQIGQTAWAELIQPPDSPWRRWIGFDLSEEQSSSPIEPLLSFSSDGEKVYLYTYENWQSFGGVTRPARVMQSSWQVPSGDFNPRDLERLRETPPGMLIVLRVEHLDFQTEPSEDLFHYTPPEDFEVFEELPDGEWIVWGDDPALLASAQATTPEGQGRMAPLRPESTLPPEPQPRANPLMIVMIGGPVIASLGAGLWFVGRSRELAR